MIRGVGQALYCMKVDFAKNTRRNMVAGALNKVVGLLFPFLNRTLFLWLMGPEYLGLNGLFGSILGVLMLAELGFGTAVVCSMYKPIADDDRALVSAYLKFYRKVYRWVGAVIFTIGLAMLPFIRNLVHGDLPPDVNLHVLYLIHLVNTSVSYFLFAYRGSVLAAHHRVDVLTNIRTGVSALQYVTVFMILLLTRNYYHYVLATVVFTVIQNILVMRESRRLFPDIEPKGNLPGDMRHKVVSDVKSIFLHKIGGVISYQVDNIVMSSFLGLVAVASYGNYYYVVTAATGFVWTIYYSMLGGFGNKIHTESRKSNFDLFMRAHRLVMAVVVAFCAYMAALYQPFMEIWTRRDPDLMRHALTPILMVVYFYVSQSRQTLLTFKSAAALWKQDRLKPIVAGVVNLALNITLVICLPERYKLDGVVFSTIVSFLFIQIPWEAHVVFSNFFDSRQASVYWISQAKFLAAAAVSCALTWQISCHVHVGGTVGLILKALAVSVVALVPLCKYWYPFLDRRLRHVTDSAV